MLREIMIENVAVIEKAGVQFGAGLNVLSGETGAGKSILIDSINAILGNRTSRELVRSHTPKALSLIHICGGYARPGGAHNGRGMPHVGIHFW